MKVTDSEAITRMLNGVGDNAVRLAATELLTQAERFRFLCIDAKDGLRRARTMKLNSSKAEYEGRAGAFMTCVTKLIERACDLCQYEHHRRDFIEGEVTRIAFANHHAFNAATAAKEST